MPSADRSLLHYHRHILLLLPTLPFLAIPSTSLWEYHSPSANPSTVWINDHYLDNRTQPNPILLVPNSGGPTFGCGFYSNSDYHAVFFVVFALYIDETSNYSHPQVVWSANRARPVGTNATLNFTASGDLILSDADGRPVWSTGTSGRAVAGMNITESGNLVLFDRSGAPVWQSVDHPTDSLVLGQMLRQGQRLAACASATNWTDAQVYLTVLSDGFYAFIGSNPPQLYYRYPIGVNKNTNTTMTYIEYKNGRLETSAPDRSIPLTPVIGSTIQFMRFESDGHLRTYWGSNRDEWHRIDDVLSLDVCEYPTVCGEYGLCSNNGECICPRGVNTSFDYFQPIDHTQPSLGCYPVTPLSCQSMEQHRLLMAYNASYFDSLDSDAAAFHDIDEERCKQECLKNCSCKAAIFNYNVSVSSGYCFLPWQLFSLRNNPWAFSLKSSVYIKVQDMPVPPPPSPVSPLPNPVSPPPTNVSPPPAPNSSTIPRSSPPLANETKTIAGTTVGIIGAILAAFILRGITIAFVRRKKAREEDEDELKQVPGLPTRFSFAELKSATNNFSKKLGQGGFGSVYEGKIGEDMIAVKRLDGVGQGTKEFLAEVETLGRIHHIKLVRLIGFCAQRSHRLLVYEYMCKGSLDRWIFGKCQNPSLDWQTRRRIITDIAKGLSYLHEECSQRIAHLDIKPQNILLDGDFNAKVSDFGLSKLIGRDEKQVMTRMRGTPGYLAPEWLTSIITEKVDIYSFGIVVLEIVCGRKNLDYSQPEESFHLLSLLQEKIKSDQLEDMVDSNCRPHEQEATEMIKLAVWCLQRDSSKRPSMSTVVKVMEGAAEIETKLDYDFFTSNPIAPANRDNCTFHLNVSASLSPCPLSGPR